MLIQISASINFVCCSDLNHNKHWKVLYHTLYVLSKVINFQCIVAAQQGWTFDEKVSVIYPKKTKSSTKEIEEPQARLAELVDIVSFLEN